ncbi:hypothetical protein P4534_21205 [Peribacillus butanolivorans]|uniref:hypothetical protein n=1 Tax=Peribacillus butanolivorans TaxID=421767 RepID=UPI002E1A5C4A|nr:hypothetical protein [Peribacillus butanolivorans]
MRQVFSFIQSLSESRLELLQQYSEEVEYLMRDKLKDFIGYTDNLTKDFPPDILEDFWDFYLDDYHQIKTDYPSVLRYSIIVSAYSTLEQTLMRVHNQHSTNREGYKKYKKNRSDILAIIEYIKRDMGIKIPNDFMELTYINKLTKIRNNIVHCNGRIYDDKNKDRLYKIIKKTPHIAEHSNEIMLEKEFIEIMLTNIINFLKILFNTIELKNREKDLKLK